jgi:transposase InsO family protein
MPATDTKATTWHRSTRNAWWRLCGRYILTVFPDVFDCERWSWAVSERDRSEDIAVPQSSYATARDAAKAAVEYLRRCEEESNE